MIDKKGDEIMKIKKDQNSITVEFSVGEWHGIVKDNPKTFTDVVNAIAGSDYITFPSEDCFGDVKGGITNDGNDDLEHRSLRNLIRKCEDAANRNPKPPVNPDPAKAVEENRETLLEEIKTVIGPNLSEKEKVVAMKKGVKIIDNLATLGIYAKENALNLSNKEDIDKLRKKIAEVMEEDDEEEDW